jgi:hypothetical protein
MVDPNGSCYFDVAGGTGCINFRMDGSQQLSLSKTGLTVKDIYIGINKEISLPDNMGQNEINMYKTTTTNKSIWMDTINENHMRFIASSPTGASFGFYTSDLGTTVTATKRLAISSTAAEFSVPITATGGIKHKYTGLGDNSTLSRPFAQYYSVNSSNGIITIPAPTIEDLGVYMMFRKWNQNTNVSITTNGKFLPYQQIGSNTLTSTLSFATTQTSFLCIYTYWSGFDQYVWAEMSRL